MEWKLRYLRRGFFGVTVSVDDVVSGGRSVARSLGQPAGRGSGNASDRMPWGVSPKKITNLYIQRTQ